MCLLWIIVYTQDQVAKRIEATLPLVGDTPGHLFTRRPWQSFWFAAQVGACLDLWGKDGTLVDALELAKSFLAPCDVLNALWPCAVQEQRVSELRERLDQACAVARVDPPLTPEYNVPSVLRAVPHGGYHHAYAT